MDRLAAGSVIAIAALAMNGGLVKDVMAEDSLRPSAAPAASASSPIPAAALRSGRVLSLLLTLEALRAAPDLLNRTKA